MTRKTNPSATITKLDPDTEYEEIIRVLSTVIFPWDIERSLEFALYRTYAVPSISNLLAHTGEFTQRPQKRYDDTELLLSEISENGLGSSRGQSALGRINAMHGRYNIANSDFLYVLSTFIFEPIRWLDHYGWRPMSQQEQKAWFNYYKTLGQAMKIKEIPDDIASFEQFNRDYEAQYFRYHESNRKIACATRDLFLGFYLPKWLWWLGRPGIYTMLDQPLRSAFNFPTPGKGWDITVKGGLKLRGWLLKKLPKNNRPYYITQRKRPSYPLGYAIEKLGTFPDNKDSYSTAKIK